MSNKHPDQGSVQIPMEMWEALRPHAEGMGALLPGMTNLVSTINVATNVRTLGLTLGPMLRDKWLFRYGHDQRLITFESDDDVAMVQKDMTPTKFSSWIEKHVRVVKEFQHHTKEVTMGDALANKLLQNHELTKELPKLNAILGVRVPVLRKDGPPTLCSKWWDKEKGTFCHDEVPYEMDWDVKRSLALIEDWVKGFPFADRDPSKSLWENRSFLTFAAALVGVYVRRLLPPGTLRPMFLCLANDQGSGKSLLVSLLLAPCFGLATNTDLPLGAKGMLDQGKFQALTETVARTKQEKLWLDDVPQGVFSNALNRFLTSPAHTGRNYGNNNEMFEEEAVTQVFMTGNQVRPSRDLMQRALVCEFYLEEDSESREFKNPMTATWLAKPAQRAQMLSALWALTRNWIEQGMPQSPTKHKRSPDWSLLVGGILHAAGVTSDPFELPVLPTGGDQETEEWKKLMVALADVAESEVWTAESKNYAVDMKIITDVARKNMLLVEVFGTPTDKDLTGGVLKKIGLRLSKFQGRSDLKTTSGRRFQFGKRKQASHYVYPITWLDEWTDEGTEPKPDSQGAQGIDFASKTRSIEPDPEEATAPEPAYEPEPLVFNDDDQDLDL